MAGSMWHDDRTERDYAQGRRGGGNRGGDRDRSHGGGYGRRDRDRSPVRRGGDRGGDRGADRPAAAPGCKVFVGNLAYRVSWQDLKDHMREVGEVAFTRVMMGPDGRSKGCGVVEYTNAADAEEAIRTLHDTDLKGRAIFVREDREEGDGDGGRPHGRGEERPARRPRGDVVEFEKRAGRGGGRGDRGGRKERGGREKKEPLTAEKLDEDLDSYFAASKKGAKGGDAEAKEAAPEAKEAEPEAADEDEVLAEAGEDEVLEDLE